MAYRKSTWATVGHYSSITWYWWSWEYLYGKKNSCCQPWQFLSQNRRRNTRAAAVRIQGRVKSTTSLTVVSAVHPHASQEGARGRRIRPSELVVDNFLGRRGNVQQNCGPNQGTQLRREIYRWHVSIYRGAQRNAQMMALGWRDFANFPFGLCVASHFFWLAAKCSGGAKCSP